MLSSCPIGTANTYEILIGTYIALIFDSSLFFFHFFCRLPFLLIPLRLALFIG